MKIKTSMLLCKLVLIILITTNLMHSQTISTAYETAINNSFTNIDKTKVPYKLLVDYAMEFAELSAYDGTLTTNNYIHKGTYTSIYNTLLMSRVQANVPDLISPTNFKNNWDNLRQANTIVLSGLYYKYSKFKDNAHPKLITISKNKLYDKYVKGIWQNPYEVKDLFAVSAPILKYNDLTVNVKLPASLWYTNQSSSIQNIEIDFNDGNGYQTMAFGQTRTISYGQAGVYDWTYKLTLNNNTVLYSQSKLQVDGVAPIVQPIAKRTINEPCVLDFFGIDQVEFAGTQTFQGIANTATIQIDYRAGNDCSDGITKPLIVAEGFDSGLLGVENPLGENDYRNFRQEAFFFSGNLGGELNDYDIIYVNWDQGRDFLQRNALLLEDIITWVNSVKTTNEQNVLLGQSMGGVIARYALADMEDNINLNHDTSLYISHDAPHQGANIPIGIQYFARHMVDQFVSTPLGDYNIPVGDGGAVSIEDIEAVFNSSGTRQLLANNINSSFNLDNSIHDSWQTELENIGYPQLTRNIAISNGNHCANPQLINPQDTLFSLNGKAGTGLLTDLLIQYIPILGTINDLSFIGLAILFNEPALLVGIIPGNSKFSWDFVAKALPTANTIKQVYKGRITFTKKILFLVNININLTNRSYNNQGVNLSYDYYPGGFFPVPLNLDQANSDINNLFFSLNINATSADQFNFIPTPSALDIGRGTTNLFNSDYFVKYNAANPPLAPKDTPFDNFTTSFTLNSDLNERHISFNERNGDWLALELNNIANDEDNFNCSFICDNSVIAGPSSICSLIYSYTFSVPSGGDNYNWAVLGNSAVLEAGPTPNTIRMRRLLSNSGWVTLRVNITSDNCGNAILEKDVYIGAPTVDSIIEIDPNTVNHISSANGNCDDIGLQLNFAPNNQSVLEIEWEKITTDVMWSREFDNSNDRNVILYPNCNKTFEFRIRARNTCGWSNWQNLSYEIDNCNSDCGSGQSSGTISSANFEIYPVPADTNLYVKVKALANGVIIPNLDLNIQLFNSAGIKVIDVNPFMSPANINVSSLPAGTYTIIITYQNITESHQIIIQ